MTGAHKPPGGESCQYQSRHLWDRWSRAPRCSWHTGVGVERASVEHQGFVPIKSHSNQRRFTCQHKLPRPLSIRPTGFPPAITFRSDT